MLITILLGIGKVLGWLTFGWFWVLTPVWIATALVLFVIAVAFVAVIVEIVKAAIKDEMDERK
ncbi:MAG: hypothetical protein L0K82_01375 [Pisciglobus halotolerans]|nr:hypothetical protein [Pisciglobus halotolerans]